MLRKINQFVRKLYLSDEEQLNEFEREILETKNVVTKLRKNENLTPREVKQLDSFLKTYSSLQKLFNKVNTGKERYDLQLKAIDVMRRASSLEQTFVQVLSEKLILQDVTRKLHTFDEGSYSLTMKLLLYRHQDHYHIHSTTYFTQKKDEATSTQNIASRLLLFTNNHKFKDMDEAKSPCESLIDTNKFTLLAKKDITASGVVSLQDPEPLIRRRFGKHAAL